MALSLKATIKAWERDFKNVNGRPPTVDDIRKNNDVADNYRLYRKLSKFTTAPLSAGTTVADLRKAPPRKSEPLTTFNPFSPRKNSASQPTPPQSGSSLQNQAINSLATPHTAVSRARKRLRGEPVSPTPLKGKRLRVPSQLKPGSSGSSCDDDLPAIPSTLFNSPARPPHGSKSFNLLFKETSRSSMSNRGTSFIRTSRDYRRPLFISKPETSFTDSLICSHSPLSFNFSTHSTSMHNLSTTEQNYLSADEQTARPLLKRPLSSLIIDEKCHEKMLFVGQTLIPPSPISSGVDLKPLKTAARKKTKTMNCNDDSPGSGDDEYYNNYNTRIKLVVRSRVKSRTDLDPDPDPALSHVCQFTPCATPQLQSPDTLPVGDFHVDLPDGLRHILSINADETKVNLLRQERLVRALVSGTKTTHYDSSRGGEIWGVGEDHPEQNSNPDLPCCGYEEGDWEGEPVPWEVGEL